MSEAGGSFAGYEYQEKLGEGFYGSLYRALGTGPQEARILHVADALASAPRFAEALTQFGSELGLLEHRHVQQTILVGRRPDGVLVVITQAIAGPVTLESILQDAAAAGRDLPAPVALALARSLGSALVHAHGVGIAHGNLHPRSVLVDIHGVVRVADFAPARALAAAAAAAGSAALLDAPGYAAPELAAGAGPSVCADVHSLGVLIDSMLGPGIPPAIRRTIDKAREHEPGDRFPSAMELRAELRAAISTSGSPVASDQQVAAFAVEVHGASHGAIDRHTDDVLAELAGPHDVAVPVAVPYDGDHDEPTTPEPERLGEIQRLGTMGSEPADADLDALVADLGVDLSETELTETDAPTNVVAPAGPQPAVDGPDLSDARLASPRFTTEGQEDVPTAVDHRPGQLRDDPVSELIRAGGDPHPDVEQVVRLGDVVGTPPEPSKARGKAEGARAVGRSRARRAGEEEEDEDTYIPPALTDSDLDWEEVAQRAVSEPRFSMLEHAANPALARPQSSTGAAGEPRTKSSNAIWLMTTAVALGALFLVLYMQTDVFHPERRRAKARAHREQVERERREAEARAVRAGSISIDSEPEEAAVWLLLGHTPLDSLPLPAELSHQVRVEQEGYAPVDLTVTRAQWTGAGDQMRAALTAALQPLPDRAAPPPAAPPAPESDSTGLDGRGVLHIESNPPGAKAYLLVGFTPDVTLSAVRAGVAYEFKVVKDGYTPGFVRIEAQDWREGEGFKAAVRGSAELQARPRAKSPRPHGKGRR